MGNIAYNSFKRNMSNDDFTSALKEIAQSRFGNKVVVDPQIQNGKTISWVIAPSKELCPSNHEWWMHHIEFFREGKRKFGTKHPHSDWGQWILAIIQNELSKRYNGRISDEGVSGTWKGDTTKYPTFRSWMESLYRNLKQVNPEAFEHIVCHTPEQLRNM